MPPTIRNENSIPRFQISHFCTSQSLSQAWKSLKIRGLDVSYTDRHAGKRFMKGAEIEICQLFRRKTA